MTSGGGGEGDIVPSSAKRALGLGVEGLDSCSRDRLLFPTNLKPTNSYFIFLKFNNIFSQYKKLSNGWGAFYPLHAGGKSSMISVTAATSSATALAGASGTAMAGGATGAVEVLAAAELP